MALFDAVETLGTERPIALKWPNDLLLGDSKLAGVLIERLGDRIVAGFGVNLAGAPDLGERLTASLEGISSPEAFAPLLAGSFARWLAAWRSGVDVRADWLRRAHPVGTLLIVHAGPEERISGTFDGLEPDGALRLRTAEGTRIVRAGDVEL